MQIGREKLNSKVIQRFDSEIKTSGRSYQLTAPNKSGYTELIGLQGSEKILIKKGRKGIQFGNIKKRYTNSQVH